MVQIRTKGGYGVSLQEDSGVATLLKQTLLLIFVQVEKDGEISRVAHCNALQYTATYCNTLQHTATHGNTLQHTATLPHATNLQCASEVTPYNALQHSHT